MQVIQAWYIQTDRCDVTGELDLGPALNTPYWQDAKSPITECKGVLWYSDQIGPNMMLTCMTSEAARYRCHSVTYCASCEL